MLTILQMEVDAVLSFNGLLIEQKEVLDQVIKAPYIYILIDHPIDHLGRIQNLREGDILTLMDRHDAKNLAIFGYDIKNLYMLPYAAIELSVESQEKTIDVLVSGSYSDMSKYEEYINGQSPAIRNICKEVIDNCIADSAKYYIEVFLEVFEKRGISFEFRLNETPEFIKMVREIGRYIYSVNRLKVLLALARKGLIIDIYGKGWSTSPLSTYLNVRIHEPVNYWQTQELMRKAKVVINFQALLRDGTHERVFAGMAARSVVVTNETPYLRELFKEDEELIFYNFNNVDAMVEAVQAILQDDEQREKISEAAWQAVKGVHTFEERAQTIIKIFNEERFGN
ncbi:glycosyltransferase family protein [Lysinibacillus sphaericus]|uniref:glycosyltransferase family protein n=1 Tax=Lysinibacillus sphaericus TaxID=1421 RepID=UPI0009B844AE|nr:glycosyltransferase [Lysinibacillus sphaericus]